MNTLFMHPNLSIFRIGQSEILLLRWKGVITGNQFRDLACEVVRKIKAINAKGILSDNREWEVISPNDYGWAASQWFPLAESAGIRKMASIVSRNIFHADAERDIQNIADVSEMLLRNFRNENEALHWLGRPEMD